MKITILLIAFAVSVLVDLQGYKKTALAIMFVAIIEFWYESNPVRQYKQRVKGRREIREYLAKQRVSRQFWRTIEARLFAPQSRRAYVIYAILVFSLLFGQTYLWALVGWDPLSFVESLGSELHMPSQLASINDVMQLLGYFGLVVMGIIAMLAIPIVGAAAAFLINQFRRPVGESPPAPSA